ncbi:MAG: D-alanyl-D-alanine carboxypeptidase family protein [Acidimicrobiales bacterium]
MSGRHASRGRRRVPTAEDRLRSLGEQIPALDDELANATAKSRARRVLLRGLGIVLAVAVVSLIGAQWFRPIPRPFFRATLVGSIRLSGTAPSLSWPKGGSSALSVAKGASLGRSGSPSPLPIANIADVLTAYVVLNQHPLGGSNNGPTIRVTSSVVAAYRAGSAEQEAEIPVKLGESLSERQALEGMLIANGNDMATLLADWDAGSISAFVTEMNATARSLGLTSTHVSNLSGLGAAALSTPSDLISLGEAATAVPGFAQIVAMPQVSLPFTGTAYNLDANLGTDGFVGIKTGNNSAGGCYLFEADKSVDGQSLVLVGAVLGQVSQTPTTTSLDAADVLVRDAFAHATKFAHILSPGAVVGRINVPWGKSIPVTAPNSPGVVAWPGLMVPYVAHIESLPSDFPPGTRIGAFSVVLGSQHLEIPLYAPKELNGPSLWWRLTRI